MDKPKRPPKKAKPERITVGGTPYRFVTAKLYGQDAEIADWLAKNTNLTDLVTSAVRLQYANLQKFFNKTLPDYLSNPRIPPMSASNQTMVDIHPKIYQQYVTASKALEKRLGKTPGPEFLMSIAIQREDPTLLADEYAATIIEEFTQVTPKTPKSKKQ